MVSSSTPHSFPVSGQKILIVDDDRLNTRILEGILSKIAGYVTAESYSGDVSRDFT